jgi:TetR/AcrR family transcriptional regulator, regulator of cefoperazone and chloramphenicol sensitivity
LIEICYDCALMNARAANSVNLIAPAAPSGSAGPARPSRSDGAHARQRLLVAALKLFASNGFSKTSTRQIAVAAGVNISAISYYFGDKAALYRSVFVEPMCDLHNDTALFTQPSLSLHLALVGYYTGFLAPMKQGDLLQQCVRLYYREMIEPTGLWAQEIEHGIKPVHKALCGVLCRHLDLKRPDEEIHRLGFAIAALAVQMFVGRDLIDAVAPRIASTPAAVDRAVDRLAVYALAMVDAERARRAAPRGSTSVSQPAVRTRQKP